MKLSKATLAALAFFAVSLVPTAAHAQLFRTYLASDGSDANPCTLAAPCRLLPAALAAVASYGEIWMLDSANYNTAQVDVTKSVTILAIPGAVGSIVATGGGSAINVNGSVSVTLRNLVIVRLNSGSTGVSFVQGYELNVYDCEISGVTDGIIASAPNGKVNVRNTVFHDMNTSGLRASGSVIVALDRVQINGTNTAVSGYGGSRISISNSALVGNNVGVDAFANGGTVRISVEGSNLSGNNYGITAGSYQAGDVAEVIATRNQISHSYYAGVYANESSGSTVTVVMDGNSLTHNANGVQFLGSGLATVYSRGNNTARFNGNDVMGGSLTALSGI